MEVSTGGEKGFKETPFSKIYGNNLVHEFFRAMGWGVTATLLLPKALVVTAICLWMIPVIEGIFSHTFMIRKFNKNNPEHRFKVRYIFWFILGLFVFVFILMVIIKYAHYLLFPVLFLLSAGFLSASVVVYFAGDLSKWILWPIILAVPAYYFFRAMFKDDDDFVSKSIKNYLAINAVTAALLLGTFFLLPKIPVRETIVRILPKMKTFIEIPIEKKIWASPTVPLLNVRKGKGVKFGILFTIKASDIVRVKEKGEEWLFIKHGEAEGFVSRKYMKIIQVPAGGSTGVTVQTL